MKRYLFVVAVASFMLLGTFSRLISVSNGMQKETRVRLDDDSGELKGEVKVVDFDSKNLGTTREVKVYLPPGHDKKKRYPVAYIFDSFEQDWPALVEAEI